jgi:hypothetical protein
MDRMNDEPAASAAASQLDALWKDYRDACPDPEAGAGFMPGLWQRIEARRVANLSIFRRLVQVCVVATLALTVLMGVVLIPRLENALVSNATYVDVLAADHPNTYVDILTGDIQ